MASPLTPTRPLPRQPLRREFYLPSAIGADGAYGDQQPPGSKFEATLRTGYPLSSRRTPLARGAAVSARVHGADRPGRAPRWTRTADGSAGGLPRVPGDR